MKKAQRSKKQKIGAITLSSMMAVSGTLPYAVLSVHAAENIAKQAISTGGGSADSTLLTKWENQLKLSNQSADQIIPSKYGSFSALPTGNLTGGQYVVDSTATRTNWTISGNVVIWVKKGAVLNVTASDRVGKGTNNSLKGDTGATALTIARGANVTFVGEGTVDIRGGTGGTGGIWTTQATNGNAQPGGAGGTGGLAIANSGTLKFDSLYRGKAIVTGGKGGQGGTGQKSIDQSKYKSNGTIFAERKNGTGSLVTAGAGGAAGNGGNAINGGTVIINCDDARTNLSEEGSLSTGHVNVKGGQGGTGGIGGAAGDNYVEYFNFYLDPNPGIASQYAQVSSMPSPVDTDKADEGKFIGTITTVQILNKNYEGQIEDGGYHRYDNKPGTGGAAGAGGLGIYASTLQVTSGIATIEGGNVGTSGGPGAASRWMTNGPTYYETVTNRALVTRTVYVSDGKDADGNPQHKIDAAASSHVYNYTLQRNTMPVVATADSGVAASSGYGLNSVTVKQSGGTIHAIGGNANLGYGVSGGTNTSSTGGSFYGGGTAVNLGYIEGYGSTTEGTNDFNANAKNFYVLNKGDQYLDANGNILTAKGILVNGKEYGSQDVFVNPQGYVYLNNVANDAKVEMQVAIGGQRIGDADTNIKYVSSDAGIYTYTGTGTTGLTSRFAQDDTSMDVDWLAEQKNTGFTDVKIGTSFQLAAFAYAVNHGLDGAANAHATLTNNIDLNAMNWTPIGTKDNPFIGTLDGANYSVKNMRIDTIDDVDAYGLFGYVTGFQNGNNITAKISNLTITNGNFASHAVAQTLKINGAASSPTSGAGYGVNNHFIVKQSGDVYAGALIGKAENVAVDHVNVESVPMSIEATGDVYAGGLIGSDTIRENAESQTIQNVNVNNSSLHVKEADNSYVGGIVGLAQDIDIIDSIAQSQGSANAASGKGTNASLYVDKATGTAFAGGIVGRNVTTLVKTSRIMQNTKRLGTANADLNITVTTAKTTYIGGIVGEAQDIDILYDTLENNAISGTLMGEATSGDLYLGGVVGHGHNQETKYRYIQNAGVLLAATANIVATGTQDVYAGGIIGKGESIDTNNTHVKQMYIGKVTAQKAAYLGGVVGYSQDSVMNVSTVSALSTYGLKATGHGSWVGGSTGYAQNTSVTAQKVSFGSIESISDHSKSAFAGGIVGQATVGLNGDNVTEAISHNEFELLNGDKRIQASTDALLQSAYAGGIVGDATNINVFTNTLKNTNANSNVIAQSKTGSSYAGGVGGRIDNSKTKQSLIFSDTTINNMNISAVGENTTTASGNLAYAGGVAGLALGSDVQVGNVKVTGTSSINALGTNEVFAGRLFGHTSRATILNSAPSAGSSVTAKSINKNTYAGGLVGKLDSTTVASPKEKQSTIAMSGVTKTNVDATAGNAATVYAGGLLGYGEFVQITKSSVNHNYTKNDVASSLTAKGQKGFVGGIGGQVINPNDVSQISYMVDSTTSQKIDTTGITGQLTSGAMYGQINNVRIASSYAKNYGINSKTLTDDDLSGGLFGKADHMRLLQVYGTAGNAGMNGIANPDTYGIAAQLTGTNQFYGVYTTHQKWAKDASGNDVSEVSIGSHNEFKACYYWSGSAQPATSNKAIWGDTNAWGAENYTEENGVYSLKEKSEDKVYYDGLKAVNVGANQNDVANAMRYFLHFTTNTVDEQSLKDISDQDMTTAYEKELEYKLSYSVKNKVLADNYGYPDFVEPYFATLIVNPGLDYGHVVEGSSIIEPGSNKFGVTSGLVFTAEPENTPEESSFWFEFKDWKIQKVETTDTGTTTTDITPTGITAGELNKTTVDFEMPASDIVVTANFQQKDNRIRRRINQETADGTYAELLRRSKLDPSNPLYVDKNNIDEKTYHDIMIDVATDVISKYVGTSGNSYRQNIADVYDKINDSSIDSYHKYDTLLDKNRVNQQLGRDMVEDALASKDFKTAISDGLTLDEVSSGVGKADINDAFTSKGKFKDYVNSQLDYEDFGTTNATLNPSLDGTLQVNDKNELEAIIRPLDGTHGVGVETVQYAFADPMGTDFKGWEDATYEDGQYTLPMSPDKITKEDGTYIDYIYVRQVDATGFETVTRKKLNVIETAIDASPINDGQDDRPQTSNTIIGAIGKEETDDDGQVHSQSISFGETEYLKSSQDFDVNEPNNKNDKGSYYYTPVKESTNTTIVSTTPKPGAYIENVEISYNGETKTVSSVSDLTDGKVIIDGKEFTFTGDRYSNKDSAINAGGQVSFVGDDSVNVTVHYGNLLGEINASKDHQGTTQNQEIANVIESTNFDAVFTNSDKSVADAHQIYNDLSDQQKQTVQDYIVQFMPKDSSGKIQDYSYDEFIDVFNSAVYLTHYQENILELDDKGQPTSIKESDFTSGSWDQLKTSLNKSLDVLTGKTTVDDGSAKQEAADLKTATDNLKQAIKELTFNVESFTVNTANGDWMKLGTDNTTAANKKEDLLKKLGEAATIDKVSSGLEKTSTVFPYNNGSVQLEISGTDNGIDINDLYDYALLDKDGKNVLEDMTPDTTSGNPVYTFDSIDQANTYELVFTKKKAEIAITNTDGIDNVTATNTDKNNDGIVDKDDNLLTDNDNKPLDNPKVSIEYGEELVLKVTPQDGKILDVGNDKFEYTIHKNGADETKTVAIAADGTIVIPKEDAQYVTELDMKNAFKDTTSTSLQEEIDRLNTLIASKDDVLKYTPKTVQELIDQVKTAQAVVNNSSATTDEIGKAYTDLKKAEDQLVHQYELTPGSDFDVINSSDETGTIALNDGTTKIDVDYYQNGVVKIDDQYYVQDGYGVQIQAAVEKQIELEKDHNKLDNVPYTQDSHTQSAIVKSDGISSYIPAIKGNVTVGTPTTKDNTLTIITGSMKDKETTESVKVTGDTSGTTTVETKETVYHAADIKAENITDEPESISLKLNAQTKDGTPVVFDVEVTGLETGGTKDLTVKVGDKEITLPTPDLSQVIVDGTTDPYSVEVKGEFLDKIVDAYNDTKLNKDKLVSQPAVTDVKVTTTTLPDTAIDVTPTETTHNPVDTTVNTTVPTYVLTPDDSHYTTGVQVDADPMVQLDDIIDKANLDTAPHVTATDKTYTTIIGDVTYVVKTDLKDNVLSAQMDNASQDYKVEFNLDKKDNTTGNPHFKDTKYGEATVIFKTPQTTGHVVNGEFSQKEIELTGDMLTNAQLTINGSVVVDKDTNNKIDPVEMTAGQDVKLTIAPSDGHAIDPAYEVMIQIGDKEYKGTLEDLAKEDIFDVIYTKDDKGNIDYSGPIDILVKAPKAEINVDFNDMIVSTNPQEIKDSLLPKIDELQRWLEVEAGYEDAEQMTPYVVNDNEWNKMVDTAQKGNDIHNAFTDDVMTEIDKIIKGESDKQIIDVINEELFKDDKSQYFDSLGEAQQAIDKMTQDIQDTLKNLNTKTPDSSDEVNANQIVITLPEKATGEKLTSDAPIKVSPDKGTDKDINTIVSGQKDSFIEIDNVKPDSDQKTTNVVIAVKDPTTGTTTNVKIKDNGDILIDANHDGIYEDSEKLASVTPSTTKPILITDTGAGDKIEIDSRVLDDIVKEIIKPDGSRPVAAIIESIVVGTDDKDNLIADKAVKIDEGIKVDPTNKPTVQTNTTDVDGKTTENIPDNDGIVALDGSDSEGITVDNIQIEDDYDLAGITVTVQVPNTDGTTSTKDIFIPSTDATTGGNTTTSGDKSKVTVTNKDLVAAIEKELGTALPTGTTVIDVKVDTVKPVTSQKELSQVEEITYTTVTATDDLGNEITMKIPVVDVTTAPNIDVEVSVKDKDGKVTTTHTLKDVANDANIIVDKDTHQTIVDVSGDMIKDILEGVNKAGGNVSTNLVDSTSQMTTKRNGYTVGNIDASQGIIDSTKLGLKDKPIDSIYKKTSDIEITGVESSNGYAFDGVTVHLSGQKDGKNEDIDAVIKNVSDDTYSLTVQGTTVELDAGDFTYKDGVVTLTQDAVQKIVDTAGYDKQDDYANADITSISVNAHSSAKEGTYQLPNIAEGIDNGVIGSKDMTVTTTPHIAYPDVKVATPSSEVVISVEDKNGNKADIKVAVSGSDFSVSVTPEGGTPIDIPLNEEDTNKLLESLDAGKISRVTGDILTDIVKDYNTNIKDDSDDKTVTLYPEDSKVIKVTGDSTELNLSDALISHPYVTGQITGNENVVISPVQVKDTHELDSVIVETKDDNGHTLRMELPIGELPDKVVVSITDKDGKTEEVIVSKDVVEAFFDGDISKVESLKDGQGSEVTVNGGVIKGIMEIAEGEYNSGLPDDEKMKNQHIDSISVDTKRVGYDIPDDLKVTGEKLENNSSQIGTATAGKSTLKDADEALNPKSDDVLIKGVATKETDSIDEVNMDVTIDGKDYTVTFSPEHGVFNEHSDIIVTPKADSTHPITISDVDLSDITMKKETTDSIRIPGQTLGEIMNKVSEAVTGTPVENSKLADVTINEMGIHVVNSSYTLPKAEDMPVTGETDRIDVYVSGAVNTSVQDDTDSGQLVVQRDGTLIMDVTYAKDGYGDAMNKRFGLTDIYQNYDHTYGGLNINGHELSKELLQSAVTEKDGQLTIDVEALVKIYSLATKQDVADFEGFKSIGVIAEINNPQYKTFENEYDEILELNQDGKRPINEMSKEDQNHYIELVDKLVSQFDTSSTTPKNPDTLTTDNQNHLLEEKENLELLKKDIANYKEADKLVEKIEKLYKEMNTVVDKSDGDNKGLPSMDEEGYKDLTDNQIKTIDEYREKVIALEKEVSAQSPEIQNIISEKTTNKNMSDADGDLRDKLTQMTDALDKVDEQTTSPSAVIDNLLQKTVSDLGALFDKDGAVNIHDQKDVDNHLASNQDDYAKAHEKLEQLDIVKVKVDKVQDKLDKLSKADKVKLTQSNLDDFNKIQERIQEEYEDFANVFAKEYLTLPKSENYVPGTDGKSNDSSNGLTEAKAKADYGTVAKAIKEGLKEYNQLSTEAQKAIDDVFYGPTLKELAVEVLKEADLSDIFISQVEDAKDYITSHSPYHKDLTADEVKKIEDISKEYTDKIKEAVDGKETSYSKDDVKDNQFGVDFSHKPESITVTVTDPDHADQSIDVVIHVDEKGNITNVNKVTHDASGNILKEEDVTGKINKDDIHVTLPKDSTPGHIQIDNVDTLLNDTIGSTNPITNDMITGIVVKDQKATADELSKIADEAISQMGNVVKDNVKNQIDSEQKDINKIIDSINDKDLVDHLKDVINSEVKDKNNIINNLPQYPNVNYKDYVDNVNSEISDLANQLVEKVIDTVKDNLLKNYTDLLADPTLSDKGKSELEKAYKDAMSELNGLKANKDKLGEILDFVNKMTDEMTRIVEDNQVVNPPVEPEKPVQPDEPDVEDPDVNNPDINNPHNNNNGNNQNSGGNNQDNGSHDITITTKPNSKQPTSSQGAQQSTSTSQQTVPLLESDELLTTMKAKLLESYTQSLGSIPNSLSSSSKEQLLTELKSIYDQAMNQLENMHSKEDMQKVIDQMVSDLQEKIDALASQSSKEEKSQTSKESTSSWFNIIAVILLILSTLYGFMKKHKLTALIAVDTLISVIMMFMTQTLDFMNYVFFNQMSLYFVILIIIDIILMIVIHKKGKDDNQ